MVSKSQKVKIFRFVQVFTALIFLTSCHYKNEDDIKDLILRNSNGTPIFEGTLVKDSIPTSLWKFYDDSGSVFLSINFDTINSKNSIEITSTSKNPRHDFQLRYVDGKLFEKPMTTKKLEKGRKLYMKYLAGFDIFKKHFAQDMETAWARLDSLTHDNPNIPSFSDTEKKLIYDYLVFSSKPIP